MSKGLEKEQQEKAIELLNSYPDVFAKNDLDLGHFTAIRHRLDTGDAAPI